jgi:hypothetical protein
MSVVFIPYIIDGYLIFKNIDKTLITALEKGISIIVKNKPVNGFDNLPVCSGEFIVILQVGDSCPRKLCFVM